MVKGVLARTYLHRSLLLSNIISSSIIYLLIFNSLIISSTNTTVLFPFVYKLLSIQLSLIHQSSSDPQSIQPFLYPSNNLLIHHFTKYPSMNLFLIYQFVNPSPIHSFIQYTPFNFLSTNFLSKHPPTQPLIESIHRSVQHSICRSVCAFLYLIISSEPSIQLSCHLPNQLTSSFYVSSLQHKYVSIAEVQVKREEELQQCPLTLVSNMFLFILMHLSCLIWPFSLGR